MRVYDLSPLLDADFPVWPGEPSVQVELIRDHARDGFAVSRLTMGSHVGCHVDAPYHFFAEGEKLMNLPLQRFLIWVQVVEAEGHGEILPQHIRGTRWPGGGGIVFKTGYYRQMRKEGGFYRDFRALSMEAASLLVESGIRFVGIDSPSIEPFRSETLEVHKLFARHGILILEGADLERVPPGEYFLMALPVPVSAADGVPVRALLFQPENEAERAALRNIGLA
jgi:arylformamidase